MTSYCQVSADVRAFDRAESAAQAQEAAFERHMESVATSSLEDLIFQLHQAMSNAATPEARIKMRLLAQQLDSLEDEIGRLLLEVADD